RSRSQGCEAEGTAGRAGEQVRAGHQSPDRQDARPDRPGQAARCRRRGDRNELPWALRTRIDEKWDEAVESFSRAIRLSPQWSNYHYNLGRALRGAGKLKKATDAFKKATEMLQEPPQSPYGIGRVGASAKGSSGRANGLALFRNTLLGIFSKIADPARLNEPQTEERIIRLPRGGAVSWGLPEVAYRHWWGWDAIVVNNRQQTGSRPRRFSIATSPIPATQPAADASFAPTYASEEPA